MELTELQITLLKSLAGLTITGGLIAGVVISLKLLVDKIPTRFMEKTI
jgi:hypothetical protein